MTAKFLLKSAIIGLLTIGNILPLMAEDKRPPDPNFALKDLCKEELVETLHSIMIDGKEVKYKTTVGTLLIKEENKCDPKASVFFISYTKEGVDDTTKRPITFCFNGGPGSSSVWLHLGILGPKRVNLTEEGYGLPPYQLLENEYSLLDVTDLVFIDPVSTGYSRHAPGEDPKQFHGFDEDIKSVGEFIRLYSTRFGRWDSPKFLAGESYGTTRAAGLAGYLHNDVHMYINGIIFVSSILNFQAIDFEGNDLPYLLFLPSYTATAWHHQKLSADLQSDFQKALKESEEFAMHDYALALLKGDKISQDEKQRIVTRLSRLTGLSADYIMHSNMRVSNLRFFKELLRSERRTVGRFDSRFLGIDADSAGEILEYDPSFDAVMGAFTATLNQYLRNELNWQKDEQYKVLANVWPWNYGKAMNQYLNVSDTLRQVMTKNPFLQVFVASGYYDLATSYFSAEYTFDHLGLDPSLRSHIHMAYYDSGHMMYIHKPSLIKMSKDLKQFIKDTLDTKNFVVSE